MSATPLLIDVRQTVHVKRLVLVGDGCSISIIGMQVTGQQLGLLATSIESPIVASCCTHRLHWPLGPKCNKEKVPPARIGVRQDSSTRHIQSCQQTFKSNACNRMRNSPASGNGGPRTLGLLRRMVHRGSSGSKVKMNPRRPKSRCCTAVRARARAHSGATLVCDACEPHVRDRRADGYLPVSKKTRTGFVGPLSLTCTLKHER